MVAHFVTKFENHNEPRYKEHGKEYYQPSSVIVYQKLIK